MSTSDVGIYTPLNTIVSMCLDELDKSVADADKLWILALRALTVLNFDISGETKTVRLPVLPNQTVPLPDYCLSWTKIGIIDDKGQINTLKINNSLTTFRDNNPQRLQNLKPSDINDSIGALCNTPYFSNFYYGGTVYQLFGVGGGMVTYGDCRVDETNRIILLNTDFKYPAILLECISAPQKDNDYQVQTCLQEAIIAFIKWKLKLAPRQEFYAEMTAGRRRLNNKRVVLQSLSQVLRESESGKLRS